MRVFCSICKEIFIPYSEVKVTSCGHLYHGTCISRWTKQHRTCPQCRANLTSQPFRVFFDVEKDNGTDPSTLEHQIEVLSDKLRENEAVIKNYEVEKESYLAIMEDMKKCAQDSKQKNDYLKTTVKALKVQVSYLLKQNKEVERLEMEEKKLNNKLKTLENIENILNGSSEEVAKMLQTITFSELSVKQLCTYVGILKTQFHKSEAKNIKLSKENKDLTRSLYEEKKKNSANSEEVVSNLKSINSALEKKLNQLQKKLEDHLKKDALNTSTNKTSSQALGKRLVCNMDLEMIDEVEEEKNKKVTRCDGFSRTINHWEDIVCAGPSWNTVRPPNKSKSMSHAAPNRNDALNVARIETNYAFDGMGGRKKIRLGGATPAEEFRSIKRSEEKKSVPGFKHKKIIDYYQIN